MEAAMCPPSWRRLLASTVNRWENMLRSPTVLVPWMTRQLSQLGRRLKTEVMLPTEERNTLVPVLVPALVPALVPVLEFDSLLTLGCGAVAVRSYVDGRANAAFIAEKRQEVNIRAPDSSEV